MMMFGDRKKALTSILARREKDGSSAEMEVSPEKNFDPKMEAHRSIATDLMHGIESKSVDGVARALKAHHDLINSGEGEKEESEGVE